MPLFNPTLCYCFTYIHSFVTQFTCHRNTHINYYWQYTLLALTNSSAEVPTITASDTTYEINGDTAVTLTCTTTTSDVSYQWKLDGEEV